MIVKRTKNGLELVTQPDHARLAAEILALWRADDLPEHPRRAELLLAVREHDNGWREADAAPLLDPDGLPVDFRDYPRQERFALWHRAVDRLIDTPYAAALVAHHAIAIHRDRSATDWAAFRLELAGCRDEALLEAELTADELGADYLYLELCDTLSLVACGAFDHARLHGRSIRRRAGVVEIDPFPLAGTTTFEIPVRAIGGGPYRDGPHLIGDLASARWARQPVQLAPPGP